METTIKERLVKYLKYRGIGQNKFEKMVGLSTGYISHLNDNIGSGALLKIINKSPELNRKWLLTGEGEMLNFSDPTLPMKIEDEKKTENTKEKEDDPRQMIRYWVDVSATGGGALEFLEQPNEDVVKMIHLPNFTDCTDAVNLYGDSMSPLYNNGEVIILKQWNESFIDFGHCYLIITKNGNRMVKYLNQGSDAKHLLCVSENKKYQPFEIPCADILRLYIVKGRIAKDTM